MSFDTARILKLLELTRSSNDQEALSAIRLVNKKVSDWHIFFKTRSTINKLAERYGESPQPIFNHGESVFEMIESILNRGDPVECELVTEISRRFSRTGGISTGQLEQLKKMYRRRV